MKYTVLVTGTSFRQYDDIEADSFDQAESIAKERFYRDYGGFDDVEITDIEETE